MTIPSKFTMTDTSFGKFSNRIWISDPGARCRSNFRYIVTELATMAAVKTNHHFGSQVGRKRRYRYLQKS